MKIKSLRIKNYRAIRFIEVDNLDTKTVLAIAGENGVGKSILFDAVNYLILKSLNQRSDDLNEIITKGETEFEITIEFLLNSAEKKQNNIGINSFQISLKGNKKDNQQNLDGNTDFLNRIVQKKASERVQKIDLTLSEEVNIGNGFTKKKKKRKAIVRKKEAIAGNLIYLSPHRHEQPVTILKNVDDSIFNTSFEPNQRYKRSSEQTSRNSFVMNYLLDLYLKSEQAKKDGVIDSIDVKNYENFFKEFNSIFKGKKTFKEIRYTGESNNHGYKFFIDDLIVGEPIELKDLSSGEKEVLFMLAYLKTQNPNGCIICIDEPELHIHHKLQDKLLRSIKKLGKDNQIFLMSHSIEIVRATEKIKEGVYELRRYNKKNRESQLQECKKRAKWLSLFRQITNGLEELLLTDVIIFVEGNKSKKVEDLKSDEEIYKLIFNDKKLHFISAGDVRGVLKATKETFKIVQRGIAFKKVFGIRDGDGLSNKRKEEIFKDYFKRLRILKRYSLENYFLDHDVLGKYLGLTAEDYLEKLKQICEEKINDLVEKIEGSRNQEENNHPSLTNIKIREEIKDSLAKNNFDVIPGKQIIGDFLNKHGVGYKKNWDKKTKKELCDILRKNMPEELYEIKKFFLK